MAKASINIKAASATSEVHNKREVKLDYNFPELEANNESWPPEEEMQSIADREKEIKAYCKKTSGRKLQKNATPIREGVVNLNENHTIDDLKQLAKDLKEKHKIDCFQIHIHRDEGKSKNESNYHAKMVFDWQDKETGKTLKLGRAAISQIQDTVAESLKMERGELRVNSNRKHLEPIEFKRQQEELRLKELQLEYEKLEQKKNTVRERNRQLADHIQEAERRIREIEQDDRKQSEARSERITEFATNGAQFRKEWLRMDEIEQQKLIQELDTAHSEQSTIFESQQREIADLTQSVYFEQEEIRKLEQEITSAERKIGF